jgi:hypothetical protein
MIEGDRAIEYEIFASMEEAGELPETDYLRDDG